MLKILRKKVNQMKKPLLILNKNIYYSYMDEKLNEKYTFNFYDLKNDFLDWKSNFKLKNFYKYYLIFLIIVVFGNKISKTTSYFSSVFIENILFYYDKINLFFTENFIEVIILVVFLSIYIFPIMFEIVDYFKEFRLKRLKKIACLINEKCDVKEIEKEKIRRKQIF